MPIIISFRKKAKPYKKCQLTQQNKIPQAKASLLKHGHLPSLPCSTFTPSAPGSLQAAWGPQLCPLRGFHVIKSCSRAVRGRAPREGRAGLRYPRCRITAHRGLAGQQKWSQVKGDTEIEILKSDLKALLDPEVTAAFSLPGSSLKKFLKL